MLVERAPQNLAYLHNIPGSGCGPEDGRPFRVLEDADIWRELSSVARPQTWNFQVSNTLKRVECVNFQPEFWRSSKCYILFNKTLWIIKYKKHCNHVGFRSTEKLVTTYKRNRHDVCAAETSALTSQCLQLRWSKWHQDAFSLTSSIASSVFRSL